MSSVIAALTAMLWNYVYSQTVLNTINFLAKPLEHMDCLSFRDVNTNEKKIMFIVWHGLIGKAIKFLIM